VQYYIDIITIIIIMNVFDDAPEVYVWRTNRWIDSLDVDITRYNIYNENSVSILALSCDSNNSATEKL